MRNILLYALFSIALWYLVRAAMRHYLAPSQNADRQKSKGTQNRSTDNSGNYQDARDVRYRDVE